MNGGEVCIDASVAVKWVLPEEHSEKALVLYEDAMESGRTVIGPPHLPVEVTNAVWRQVARRLMSSVEGLEALSIFNRFQVDLQIPVDLLERGFDIARQHKRPTVYDTLYVALADIKGCTLWTADTKLLKALGEKASWVRWIGDYEAG